MSYHIVPYRYVRYSTVLYVELILSGLNPIRFLWFLHELLPSLRNYRTPASPSSHSGAINGLIAAPTIGIDYAFRFGERFAISSINDFQFDQYVIEREDGSELERERLFVTSLVVMWEAMPRLQLLAGPGIETDKHGTLGLMKLGLEWELFEPHPWDVALSVAWDIKEEYDAIAVGLSIGRLWP